MPRYTSAEVAHDASKGEPGFGAYKRGCRCCLCRFANAEKARVRREQIKAGEHRIVAVGLVRQRLRYLRRTGLSDRAIAERAGIDRTTVMRIRNGKQTGYVWAETWEAIKGVLPGDGQALKPGPKPQSQAA